MNEIEEFEARRANPVRFNATRATCGRSACSLPFERPAKGPGSNAKYCGPACVKAAALDLQRQRRGVEVHDGPRSIACVDCPAVFEVLHAGSAPVRCQPCRESRLRKNRGRSKSHIPVSSEHEARIKAHAERIARESCSVPADDWKHAEARLRDLDREAS